MNRAIALSVAFLLLFCVADAQGQLYVRVEWASTTSTNIGASSQAEYRNYWFEIDYYWYIHLDCSISGPASHTNWKGSYGTVSVGCGLLEYMDGWTLPPGCYSAMGDANAQKGSETRTQGASTSEYCLSGGSGNPPPVENLDPGGCVPLNGGCSPIVINLEDGPWNLSGDDDPVGFDIDADGRRNRITWTARGGPLAFLVLDRNGNGVIDDGAELFGTATRLTSGQRAPNGFEALMELDANNDGVIDATDPVWSSLLLWVDANHDGISQASEISGITHSEIVALHTSYHESARQDPDNNSFRYMSLLRLDRGHRPYYDVFFRSVP